MTTNILAAVCDLSDRELLARVQDAIQDERVATAKLIALLMELDMRRLYLGEGCSSLFTYCTQILHLSEHAAYNRIETARVARRFPTILELFERGSVTLTAIRLLAPHLTDANHREVLERARHKTKRDVELLVATIKPRADVPPVVRKLPSRPSRTSQAAAGPEAVSSEMATSTGVLSSMPAPRRAEVKPLAPERYKIQLTVSRDAYEKLRRAQDLLRHAVPNGDPAIIVERALGLLVAELERTKAAMTQRPRRASAAKSTSRHIPAAVRRTVWQRDGARCAFTGPHGRCSGTGLLEYHHLVPFASGGETSVSNIELRCQAHNQYEADLWFGARPKPQVRERPPICSAGSRLVPERVRSISVARREFECGLDGVIRRC
jgi:5-methylcytosine-specific restriction endonuclease McrA